MKKLIGIVLVLAMVAVMFGCTSPAEEAAAPAEEAAAPAEEAVPAAPEAAAEEAAATEA